MHLVGFIYVVFFFSYTFVSESDDGFIKKVKCIVCFGKWKISLKYSCDLHWIWLIFLPKNQLYKLSTYLVLLNYAVNVRTYNFERWDDRKAENWKLMERIFRGLLWRNMQAFVSVYWEQAWKISELKDFRSGFEWGILGTRLNE